MCVLCEIAARFENIAKLQRQRELLQAIRAIDEVEPNLEQPPPAIRDAATAGLAQCRLCDVGFRRVDGVHVGSQSLGMIPNTPCERVFATCGDDADTARPWLAHVDGEPLRKQSGEARRFASPTAAYAAARVAAPRRWHP
jgi:hypothetical protein